MSLHVPTFRLIIAHDEDNVTNILNSAPPCLKVIVTIKDVKPRIVEEATSLGLKIVRFQEVEAYGAQNTVEEEPPGPATIATICFSRVSPVAIKNSPDSKPKGVMLSHEVRTLSHNLLLKFNVDILFILSARSFVRRVKILILMTHLF